MPVGEGVYCLLSGMAGNDNDLNLVVGLLTNKQTKKKVKLERSNVPLVCGDCVYMYEIMQGFQQKLATYC